MSRRAHTLTCAALLLFLNAWSGCKPATKAPGPLPRTAAASSEVGGPGHAPSEVAGATEDVPDISDPLPPPSGPTQAELDAIVAADAQRRGRVQGLFGEVMEPLTEAAKAYENHDRLDDSTWFGEDKEDNLEKINELLDAAIEVLGVSEISETRLELRGLEAEIEELEGQMVQDREARIGAPREADVGTIEGTFTTSREEYDKRIEAAENAIVDARARIMELELNFVVQMRAIGVDLDLESARSLLSTVTGDDFVQMCVVFDNVRGVTVQLQELTEESGESLEAAKRYYGSYVVLIHLMDRIQKDFVRRVREEMIPRLKQYGEDAQGIIAQAQRNMARGGDQRIGEQNIRSNTLTIQATRLYIEYLFGQAAEVSEHNARLQVDMRDAENTYDTVVLSSEVATLLREGSRNFAALLKLDVPSLRGFENSELKAEFERLTQKMIRIN